MSERGKENARSERREKNGAVTEEGQKRIKLFDGDGGGFFEEITLKWKLESNWERGKERERGRERGRENEGENEGEGESVCDLFSSVRVGTPCDNGLRTRQQHTHTKPT